MKRLPQSDKALVLRTSFSNPAAWAAIRTEIEAAGGGEFVAYVTFVDDPAYANLTKQDVLSLVRSRSNDAFVVVADEVAMSAADHPLLIIDLGSQPGNEFRAIPSTVQSIENKLSTSTMDFEEFAESVDRDGVFRGFQY
jgi:uncharacterized protein DUF6924